MNKQIRKGTHPCQDCQQNKEGKTIHGKYFSRGWFTDFDPVIAVETVEKSIYKAR